ncbi:hypothetical protein POVCU2_0086500 [Plasmodium ovale curtisi]|uniref:PIR Superfamily Protein n=1 Tax=Plasmodium ovale curtisi TaxID=864141 RepID=A0A1A8WS91_PLAOA|nr:hypothetical protein POVCU2_0086500 [Plasmodium ovale curtisi]
MNHRILPTLSCNHEETSRRKQLLSDKDDRQLFPQEQASGHVPVTQLDQSYGTFLEGESAPQSDKSITRHSQIITDVTFSARNLITLFILYIEIRISLKISVLCIVLIGTRTQNFLGRKGLVGFKLNNLQTIEMTEYASEKEHINFGIRRICVVYHSG